MRMRTICIALCCVIALRIGAHASTRPARIAELRAGVVRAVERLGAQLAKPDAKPSVRDLPWAALAKLNLGRPPAEAEALLRRAFAQQKMDPADPEFGQVPWQEGRPEIHDLNAIEFTMQAVGPILLRYGNRLSPETKTWLQPHIDAAFDAMQSHRVGVSYTNIFLMKATNQILAGEAVGRADVADTGYQALKQWVDYTDANGVHEFDSPTYYATDLNSLMIGYLCCKRPEGKARYRSILDYFWTDIAANLLPRGQYLCGPHSRNYDFVYSNGGLNLNLYIEGLRDYEEAAKADLEKAILLEGLAKGGYQPNAKILALAREPVRWVEQRWDEAPGKVRTNYITPDFAIGCADTSYGEQDKMITVDLAADPALPTIAVFADPFNSPYGKVKRPDRSGHSKPTHLALRAVCDQHENTVLALLDIDPARAGATRSLAIDLLLPSAEGGCSVGSRSEGGRTDWWVAKRIGKVGVVARFFHAEGYEGTVPQLRTVFGEKGVDPTVGRAVLTLYDGPEAALKPGHLRVGMLLQAQHCEDDAELNRQAAQLAATPIAERIAQGHWQVTADLPNHPLHADRSLLGQKNFAPRAPAAGLVVNGREYRREERGERREESPGG